MAGIKELKEAINASFDLLEKGIRIKREGLSAGLNDILALYSSVTAGIQGGDQIGVEAKDLDANELKELTALIFERTTRVLLLAGVAEDSRAMKALKTAPEVLEFGALVYERGKPIYEKLSA